MSENDESLPRLLGGRYRLEAKLGSGGMGVVFRATDLTMKRAVGPVGESWPPRYPGALRSNRQWLYGFVD